MNDRRLDVRRTRADGTVQLVVAGDIDATTVAVLDSEIHLALTPDAPHLVLDLGGVSFLDSYGLRVLLTAHRTLSDRGRTLTLVDPSDVVTRLLRVTGLIDKFRIDRSPSAAPTTDPR